MSEKIYISVDGKIKEAKGQILEQILKDRAEYQLRQNQIQEEQQAKQATLDSAIAKLAKLGLTEDEAKAIIGIQ